MAATVTKFNSDNRAIERDPVTLVFEVDSGTPALAAVSYALCTIPAGTVYLTAEIHCLQADVDATSTLCSLAHTAATLFTGSADNGGVINVIDDGISSGTLVPTPSGTQAAGTLNAVVSVVGASCSTAAKWRITVCCYRPSF